MNAVLNELPRLVEKELEAANVIHTVFHSFHEGYTVTLEEVDEAKERLENISFIMGELWSDVKHDDAHHARRCAQALEKHAVLLAAEAIQVAAMARKMQAIENPDGRRARKGLSDVLTREDVLAQLPQVGDKLMRVQTMAKVQGMNDPGPKPCTVVYVNRAHLWYEVEFDSGIRQGYKAPDINYGPKGGLPR